MEDNSISKDTEQAKQTKPNLSCLANFGKAGVQKVGVGERWEVRLASQAGHTKPAHEVTLTVLELRGAW